MLILKTKNQKLYKHPHICVGMATKNISITEGAYNKLIRMKTRENESFSEVINNLEEKKKIRLMDYFGILSKDAGEELEKHVIERRKKHQESRKKRIKQIVKELST